MCGIAGLIHRGKSSSVGSEMTQMLQALKHRGPDSTGFAVYGEPVSAGDYIMRVKVAEREDLDRGHGIMDRIAERVTQVESLLEQNGAKVKSRDDATDYALRYVLTHSGDTEKMARLIEETEGVEILSMGNGLELIKDLSLIHI